MAIGTYFGQGGNVRSLYRCYLGQNSTVRTVKEIDIGQGGSVRKVWPMYNTGYGVMEQDCSAWYYNQTVADLRQMQSIGKVGDYLTISNSTGNGTRSAADFVTNNKVYVNPDTVILLDSYCVDATGSGVTASSWYFYFGLDSTKQTLINVTSNSGSELEYRYSSSSTCGGYAYGSGRYRYCYYTLSSNATVPTGEYYMYFGFQNYGTCTWYFPYGVRIFDKPSDVVYERSSYDSYGTYTIS